MAKTKVDAMWEDLKSKGYFQSDKATFDKYFYAPGEQGYKNRKALYDDLHNKGYLQSPTYEDFAQRIGLHATANAGNASAHGTTQSMLPADVAERRIRTAKQPTPLNKGKARQRLMQQQQAIQRQQKQWQQQSDRLRQYDEKRSTTLPGGMERLGERAQEHLATGQASPVPIAPNPEVVRGDMVMGDDGRMQQSYLTGDNEYSSRAGAEAVLYRQAHPLEDELQQAYLERERLQEQMRNADAGSYSHEVGPMTPGAAFGYNMSTVFNSPELAMLTTAYNKNEQRIKTLERERDADGFWSTLGKELFSLDTWDFGAQEFMDAATMMRYFDRDDLTEQERGARQSMLENAFAKNAADQQYGQNDTFMQRAASITAQALPFVAQFLATGGMSTITEGGAELGAKAAARWATGRIGEWMLKNTGVLLGDLAAGFAMANTVGMLQTGADIMGRRQGQLMMGPDGSFYFADGKSWGRSIWEGEAANTLEYYTEMLGAHLDGLLAGAIGRAAMRPEGKLLGGWLEEFGDKVGLGALSDVFSRITGSELQAVTTNILRRGGVNEIPSEIFEEEANLLLNAMLVGDNKISDLWDPKTQADIWGGMCLSVGFMQSPGVIGGAHQTAQYYRYKHATDVADQKARARLGDEQWDALKALLDGASNQEIPVVIANMRADSEMSTLGKTAVMDYAKNLLQMRGYNLRTAAEAKSQLQQPDEAQPAVKDESGTSFAEGYNAGEQDMEPIKNRLEAAQRALIQMGYDVGSLDGKQLQDFNMESLTSMPDNERTALLEFFNARAAFEGMRQKVNDDVDTQVQHASDLVDMQTNRDTHMMHRAVLNNGQEVYVTVGRLVMTGDGTMVDTEASDESLFGYNTATGEVEQYTPQDFKSVDDPVNPEQAKAESAENIRREVAGRAAAAINGDLAFNDGDEFDILGGDNATHHIQVLGQQDEGHVVASIDGGEAQVIPKNELQAMHDNLKDAVKDMEDAAADAENTEEPLQNNGPQDNAAPVEEPFEMPLDDDGEPVWNESTPEQGYQYLTGGGLADEDIDAIISKQLSDAMAAQKKARDDGKVAPITRANAAVDYWNNVAKLREAEKAANIPAAPVAENEMKPVEAAPEEVALPTQQTEQDNTAAEPEQRKSLSEETGVLAGDRETLAQSMSPRTLEMIHKIAQQLGLKIRVYNDPNAAGENGYFDGNTNTIWVNTARRTGKLASWVLGHEMTHAMDARATDKKSKVYKDFKRIAVSFVRSVEGIEAYEARIKRTMDRYKNAPGVDASKVTRDYIEDEVACDMAGELLAEGPEFMERLFRDATDRNALERVLDAVRDFVDRMLSILNANSDEYRALTILRDSMNKMYNDVKIQGEISNELEPEADAEVETDITPADEERQERKDRQRAKRVKRKRAKRKSVTAIVEGAGLQASENVMETWKVPQADGTFKEEERWVKRPLLDDQGNVVFRMGDKEFNGNNPVSVEDLEENPDTVLNYMLNDAVNIGKLSEKKARQIRQKYADMLNAYLRRGMTTEEGTGFENLENSWMWVGEAAYKTVASNSDEQYSYSLDITRVCKKNEAVIRAISALQVKTGYGVTPGQIMDIYLTTDSEGYQVPCPVCYVFSRYINNGKYATAIVNGMQKYGKYLPGQAEEKDLAWWVDKYNEENAKAKKMKTPIDNANGDVKTILQNIDTLSREITSGTLSDEEREAKLRELHDMDERYRAALDVISQEAMPRWIKAFVLAGSAKDGWRMREDAAMPEDMDDFISHALDIRKTASAMVKYPAITRYRRAGGSAGGKEITFASNNDMGSIAMALGISKSNLDNFNNYYQLALEAGTEEERKALLEKARKRFGDARLYAQRQTLRGGQRMWSWSDNIEALASDVASNLMQLEMLGGALQTYSKQLEGVKMVAAMNGYVNASLMGYGDGVMEVDEDNITTDEEGRRVLAQDITEVNNKGRERIIANAGSPIYRNEDGKDYVLVFDDVVGIDPFGHEGNDGKFRRGLFALNEEYDRAGNILVGMNDIHVRAAMADPRVFFIIPWHASGMSNHILMQMFRVLGVDTENFKATDYTKMQEETNFLERTEKGKLKHKVTQAVRDFWNSHTYEGEFRSGIGHIPNGDRKEGLSKQQLHYRELRDAIFDGTIDNEDKKDWKRQVERDEFLSQVYRQVTTRVDDGKMTDKDKEFIYPYEYWDESSTYETADINGKRYLEYCRRMGFKPKFTGRYDEKAGYSPEGNFADDPGYWKLLIDRRMYDREGKFQDLTPVDSEGLESSMYDPMETQKEFNVTEVATNEGAERIADIVYQQEVERSGSMPTPNLSTTLEDAVEQYKDTVKRQAARVKAENDAKKAEEAARIKAEKAAERELKKAERAAEKAKQRKSLGDIIDEALQSTAIPQPEEANDSNIRYSLRTKPAPKKTLPVYKLMRLGDDGKLYPLYIDGAVPIELGQWYDADSPNMEMLVNLPAGVHLINPETGEATSLEDYNKQRGITKKSKYPSAEAVNEATANGMRWVYIEPTKGGQRRFGGEARRYWNLGINGSGTVSTYSMRPGWHAGSLPTMRQIGKGPGRNLRDDRFVWVEGEISADVDFNEEAQGNPDNDIPTHIPVDGFYMKATNANAKASQADRVGWYISGAFKANRIMSDSEARDVIDAWNADPKHKDLQVEYDFPRESGKVFNSKTMQLEDDDNGPDGPKGGKRFSIDDAAYAEAVEAGDRKKVARMVKDAVKAAMPNTKAVDRWGKPRLLYHGTPQENQFYAFNGTIYLSSNRSVANEYTHYRRTFGANPRQTGRIMPVFVNLDNPLEIDANRHLWRNIDVEWSDTPVTTRDIEQYAKDNGYDGVIIRRVRDNMYDNDTTAADVYIAFSPEQVKSAGPTYEQKKRSHFPWDDYMELDGEVGATYDDNGNLIPLSQRFDMGKRDIRYSLDAAVAEAEQMTETNPTDGQKESGNYKKGHVKVDGFDISIEQPKGSVRSGVDADGKEWSQEMHNTYGYIRGTEGVDGDHIDVFLSDHLDGWNGNVYVVDQVNKDRSFDEHKVMYGFNSEQEAREAYLSNYEEGWTGLGNITGVSREEFKKWVDSSHRKNKPFAEYKNVKPLQSTGTGDRARFSISERTDEAGNEVYTETREDGTIDREITTFKDGSKSARWFDNEGTLRENLFYFPNGEVREVANFDSDGELSRHIVYDENRRAIRHWEPRIGTDWERDENGVARGMSNGVEMVRYSLAPTFFSNAAKAVEDVKQQKAKAEQWKAMLTKAGGIKAGEDKWMGLSAWLDEHKGETLTKDEVRKFVADNGIQMEEVRYGENEQSEIFNELNDEFMTLVDNLEAEQKQVEWFLDDFRKRMISKYGEDYHDKMTASESNAEHSLVTPVELFNSGKDRFETAFQVMVWRHGDDFELGFSGSENGLEIADESAASFFLDDANLPDETRLRYTTNGLENKREIAFVVPNVEPYQENDEIHFGADTGGKAIMWARFGETRDADGNRVLVIDEIQSNRHQNARDVGYIDKAPFEAKREKVAKARTAFEEANAEVEKYVEEHTEALFSNNDENVRQELNRLKQIREEAYQAFRNAQTEPVDYNNANGVPAAPFEKNWHEVAMKRMLRLAAEEGFDKVAWTTGAQQARRYDLGQSVKSIERTSVKNDEGAVRYNMYDHENWGRAVFVKDGIITGSYYDFLKGKPLAEVFGRDIAEKMTSLKAGESISGDDLMVGGEGMKAFYDEILPRFMNKYGKRWGVKVGEVTLDTPGKEVMHSVDVNEDMKRSVMQGQPLFSLGVEQERTLMGMHNITAEKLRSALKLGGLANPSMAVINTEVGGFTNFGEISLIPSADLIASRTGDNAGTWGADAYSPRFPETHRRLGKGGDKKMRSWVKGLKMRQEMEYNTEEQFNDYYNGFNIRDNALVYPFLHEKGLSGEVDYYTHMNVDQRLEDDLREVNGDQWALLKRFDEDEEYKKKLTDIVVGDELRKINKKEGETFQEYRDRRREWAKEIRETLTEEDGYINRNLAEDLLWGQARAYRENGKFSESRTRDNAEQYIRDHGLEEEYKQYFEQKMQELGAELQVYAGSDSQGRSKYKPVSLEQVSRMMKKQGRAGGEGGIFADSPGAIRAKLLTPMKTLDQIRAKKDRLVSHEAFEQFRERYQEDLREYADVYARGSMGALADIITSSNMAATAKQYNIDLDADAVAELNKFKNRVRALPTEYFETKFERPVMLDEFKKAIIPDDLPLDLQGALQRAGLEVVEYKHGDNADRERVTLDAVKNDDNIRFSIQGLDGYTEQDVLDGVRGDIEAKLEEAGVDDVTIKGMALHGSRMRGDAREDSDLDVVMEYDGDWSEDALFDLLNDEPVYFDGIKVDVNPITRGKSGTLEQYMERSRRYDEEKIRANSAQYNDNAEARFSLSVEEANRYVETFNDRYGISEEFAELHAVDSEETVERIIDGLGLNDDNANDLRNDFRNKKLGGTALKSSNLVFIFTDRVRDEGELVNTCFHEVTHHAYKQLSQEEIKSYNNALMLWYRAKPNRNEYLEKEILDEKRYDKEDWATEAMSHFMGALAQTFGWDRIISGKPIYKEQEIINFVARIVNIITDGQPREEKKYSSDLSGETGSDEPGGPGGREGGDSGEVRFSVGDGSTRDIAIARDTYERMLRRSGFQFQEAVQDSMLSLKRLYQAILGRRTRIEDVADNQNAYIAENHMSSINAAEQHEYFVQYMKPLLAAIHKIAGKDDKKRQALIDYMMAKHGLERNLVLADRDAQEAAAAGGDYQQAYQDNREKDYSGITALMEENDLATAEALAQQLVDDYERDHDTAELWAAVKAATGATLYRMYTSGLMSKNTYDKTAQMFEYYIPLRGWSETTSDEVYGYLTDKSGPLGSPIKHAKGRSSKADDPIATIAMMADDTIRAGNRNLMKQRFLIFAQDHPSDLVSVNRLWLQYNEATDEWEPVFADIDADDTPEQVAQKVEAFEQRMEQLAVAEPDKYKRGRDAVNIPYKVVMDNLAEHQVLVKRGGETFVLTINGNPRAAQALNGMTNPDVKIDKGIVRGMYDTANRINRELSAFYTTRNPDFIMSNFLRDTLYSNCMTWVKESPNYALKFHKNFGRFNPAAMLRLFQKWENGTLNIGNPTEVMFYQFMINGGETGYTNVKDVEGHKRTIAKELRRKSSPVRKGLYLLGEEFDVLNRAVENCARFAAFVTSREMGRSIGRSVHDAKEVSVNFNKKGAGDKLMNATGENFWGKVGSFISGSGRLFYIFWNAGVQGMTNFGRAFKLHPVKASAGAASMFVLGSAVALLAQAMGGDDEDDKDYYYNLPENVRRSNICFRIGNGPWITIPLPIEFRAIYGLGEMAVGVATGKERYSDSELAYNIISQLSQLMPLDLTEGEGGWANLLPQVAKTPAELMTNRTWYGMPIYKDTPFNEDMPEWTKAYSSANQTIVAVTKWLNEISGGNDYKKGAIDWNPAKIEYALKSYFGGVTTTIDHLMKSASAAMGEGEFNWRDVPLASRVLRHGDERTAFRKAKNEYFNFKAEAEETKRLLNAYQKDTSDPVKYAELLSMLHYSPEYGKYLVFEAYNERVEDLRKAIKEGKADPDAEQLENEAIRDLVDAMHNYDNSKLGKAIARKDKDALKNAFDEDSVMRKVAAKEIAKEAGGTDSYGSPKTEYGEVYLRKRDYADLADDILLQTEMKKAKEAGDEDRAKAIDRARRELTGIKKGKHTKTMDVPGLGEGHDDEVMQRLRDRRRELMRELGITR